MTLNAARAARGAPVVGVDLALHVGDVLYGNVGATDRLDFTVIGPAINEVARMEALCEPLGRTALVSAEFVVGHGGARRPAHVAWPPRVTRRERRERGFRARPRRFWTRSLIDFCLASNNRGACSTDFGLCAAHIRTPLEGEPSVGSIFMDSPSVR